MANDQPIHPAMNGLMWVCIVLLAIGVQVFCATYAWPYLTNGQLLDTDSYTWLGHVQHILATGDWYDHSQPRANWPFGEVQHSSRPYDALLLAGTFILSPFFSQDQALFMSGAWSSPALFLVLCAMIAWTTNKVFGRPRGYVAAVLLMSQFPVIAYSIPSRADHHALIMVVLTASIGLTGLALKDSTSRRAALVAGCFAGLGVWLSPEFLLLIGASFIALAWAWIRHGGTRSRAGLLYSAGMLGAIIFALLLEYRPAELLAQHFDRISSVHLAMAMFAVGFWACAQMFERVSLRRSAALTLRTRLIFSVWGAGVTLGLFGVLYPEFFGGPTGTMDPRARIILIDMVMETGGLLNQDIRMMALYLWPAAIAIPVTIVRLISDREAATSNLWVFLAALLAIYVSASLFMLRFASYASIVSVIIVADFCIRVGTRALAWPVAMRWLTAAVSAGVCLTLILAVTNITARSLAEIPMCHKRLKEFATYIDTIGPGADQPFVIVAMADMGPEILYRTKHRVIATPSMSNQDGAVAMFQILDARDNRTTRGIIEERAIDHILICRAMPFNSPDPMDKRLVIRLMRRNVPGWLEPVPLPESLGGIFDLYRVRPD